MEIRFCGGCNPLYHREKLYEKLKFLTLDLDKEVIIILNGCQRGCIKILENKSTINVQEYLIHIGKFDEDEILKWIMGKVK
ncbi:hypothetical protein [Fusobacterium varium]|uniref:hypothetical protein n=1 Tax=Fusobacterium varium TaxID=856 RepID=UPI000BBACDA8|nr:hypothetical protein [uncultured Fusobacterium sp.]BBA51798.1 hypothetical protein FV113G1_21480 [Fusobacterium varium]